MGSNLNKIRERVGFINRETYLAFKEKYPDENITYSQYMQVLKESTRAIRDHVLENPLGFKLPYNLGYIAVDKYKPRSTFNVWDLRNSKLLHKQVPFLNLHSFGYMFKIRFYPNTRIKPLNVYKMNPHRIINRMLAKSIKGGKEYLEIDRSYYSRRFRIDETINKYQNG